MELNRNHYFAIGLIVLLLGIQLRFVESYRLNEESSRFIAEKIRKNRQPDSNPINSLLSIGVSDNQQTLNPPKWIGWALISVGAVLVLQSAVLKKPG